MDGWTVFFLFFFLLMNDRGCTFSITVVTQSDLQFFSLHFFCVYLPTYLPEEKTIYIYTHISIPSVIPNSSLVEWINDISSIIDFVYFCSLSIQCYLSSLH